MFVVDILEHTLMITMFVMVMMLLIEYFAVLSEGNWSKPFQRSSWLQIVFAAIMGIIPGCMGAFVIVSLYSHRIINFAALVTVMIATFGDEAFVMFSMIPGDALKLFIIIFVIAIVTGLILNLILKNKTFMVLPENHLKFHKHDPECFSFDPGQILPQLKKITFQRSLMLAGGLLVLFFVLAGHLDFGYEHHHDHHIEWGWEMISFLMATAIGLFIVMTVPDHFLEKHIWNHVIKKHFLKILLWTFGAILLIHSFEEYLDVENWIRTNQLTILIIAVLMGIIPESGPHIVFITLFANGSIPFIILLANSIVQDGHGALPLLAESRKSFLFVKFINILVGLIVGLAGLYLL